MAVSKIKNSTFVRTNATVSGEVAGNSFKTISATLNVPEGFEPVAFTKIQPANAQSNDIDVIGFSALTSGTVKAYVKVYNRTSTPITAQVDVMVLCVPDDMVY